MEQVLISHILLRLQGPKSNDYLSAEAQIQTQESWLQSPHASSLPNTAINVTNAVSSS